MRYNKSILKSLDKMSDSKLKKYSKRLQILKNKAYNRNKIYKRIYKKYIISVKIIEKFIKKYKLNNKYINEYTLLGDNISDIDNNFIYIINKYAFDIRELKKILETAPINPYTRERISRKHIIDIRKKILELRKKKIKTNIDEDVPLESLINAKAASLFNDLSRLHVYPNLTVFSNYSDKEFLIYLKHVRRFRLIKNEFSDKDLEKIEKAYKSDNKIKYRCIGINILKKIISKLDGYQSSRALILTENLYSNITMYYNRHIIDNYSYVSYWDSTVG